MAKDKSMESFSKIGEPKEREEENDELINKVQEHLKELGSAEDDSDMPPTPEPKSKKDDSESTPDSDGDEPESEPAEEESDEDRKPAGDDKGKPPIPDNHYRALIHQGWDAEKISDLYEKDSGLLLELAEKAYNDVNNLSRQFANLGRAKKELDVKQIQGQQIQQAPLGLPQQKGTDLDKLREQYENDPFGATVELMKIFGRQEAQPIQRQQAQSQSAATRQQVEDDLALTQHLIHFWGDESMKPYNDFYGPMYNESGQPYLTADHLTPGQAANRQQVYIKADQIIAGAALQGENMPIQQALAMAHMIVSAPISKQILRNELTTAVKKKAKGVTLKPSQRKATPKRKKGEAKTEKELEKTTEGRLADYKEHKPIRTE